MDVLVPISLWPEAALFAFSGPKFNSSALCQLVGTCRCHRFQSGSSWPLAAGFVFSCYEFHFTVLHFASTSLDASCQWGSFLSAKFRFAFALHIFFWQFVLFPSGFVKWVLIELAYQMIAFELQVVFVPCCCKIQCHSTIIPLSTSINIINT